MKTLKVIAAILVIVGALNWGLVAVARFDLVAAIFGMTFGETSALTSIVYGLVGLSGLYFLYELFAEPAMFTEHHGLSGHPSH